MDEDIYYLDTRNADVRDHRVIRPGAIVPARAVAMTPTSLSSRVAYAPPSYAPPAYGSPASAMYPPQFFGPAPLYSQGPIYGQPFMGQLGSLFGGLNLGQVVALAADAFAAFKALPTAPAPTGDVATDVANDVLYQSALARELKVEKQIEFGGRLAWGLLGGR
jgi:hypothetical protein